jgi:DNA-binding NarL/FixJ family response regulator
MNVTNDLTKQEHIVLALVAEGWRTARIAQELYLSPRTVETHLAHICSKLGVSSRTEAATYAFHTGLLARPESRVNMSDRDNEIL